LERERQEVLERRKELLNNGAQVDKDRAAGLEALTKSYDQQIKERVKDITRARRIQTRAGIPLYVILGGVVASAFATSLLQAVLIGFGWTGRGAVRWAPTAIRHGQGAVNPGARGCERHIHGSIG
jgi:anti-sigma factor RsiW